MNLLLLEMSAIIAAAGILGLMVGWKLRFAAVGQAVDKLQMHERLLHAEAILEKQSEVDELLDQIALGDAERDELIDLNRSLKDVLERLERATLPQRGTATEQRLRTYDHGLPAAGGRPNRADWQAEPDDETQLLNLPLSVENEDGDNVVDETVVLVDPHDDPDATLTIDGPLRSRFGNV